MIVGLHPTFENTREPNKRYNIYINKQKAALMKSGPQ